MKPSRLILLVLLGLSFDVSARSRDHFITNPDFIIGGSVVEQDDPIAATTLALLIQRPAGVSICTASILTDSIVLTAAHCLGKKPSDMKLVFSHNLRDPSESGTSVTAKNFVRHPRYMQGHDDQDENDIALVSFEGGLPQGYSTVSLLADADALRDGQEVTLAGYGITTGDSASEEAQKSSGILRKVDTKVLKAAYGDTETLIDQNQGKAGACHGDSGGPAFIRSGDRSLLFAVTSRTPSGKPNDCATESIYTRVLAHQAFLKAGIAKLRKEIH